MNNPFDDRGKRMPYRESGEYVDNLIDATTDRAIKQQAMARRSRLRGLIAASAAAVAVLIVSLSISLFNGKSTQQAAMTGQGPLDEFLNTLSDEEAAQLTYYEIDEIPEY